MVDPTLSAEGAELADVALVHSVRLEVVAAAAGLQEWPLDDAAAVRMRQALTDRVPSARQALSRLQSQSPLPGGVVLGTPRGLRPLPSLVQDTAQSTPPAAGPGPARGGWPGPGGAAS